LRSRRAAVDIVPSRLEREVAESTLLHDILNALCDLGLRIAIDDFGTCYASYPTSAMSGSTK
jgi:EAL domain-containing protein (putative c-di-GMP-specific phosphodiesterase class I)